MRNAVRHAAEGLLDTATNVEGIHDDEGVGVHGFDLDRVLTGRQPVDREDFVHVGFARGL